MEEFLNESKAYYMIKGSGFCLFVCLFVLFCFVLFCLFVCLFVCFFLFVCLVFFVCF